MCSRDTTLGRGEFYSACSLRMRIGRRKHLHLESAPAAMCTRRKQVYLTLLVMSSIQ